MVDMNFEKLEKKIEEALANKLKNGVLCSMEEDESTNTIVVSIEMDSFYYEEDKVELLRDLVKRLKELGYDVEGIERAFWTAETIKDLLTEEIIDEREAFYSDHYYMFEIKISVNKDKLDKFMEDIIKAIDGLKTIEQEQ